MPRENTVRWSRTEEKNLLPWLSRNQMLSWKARSRAYFKEHGILRSGESLRGKQNDLRRKLQRAVRYGASPATHAIRQFQHREQPGISGLAPSFPIWAQRTPEFNERLLLEYFRSAGDPKITMFARKQRPFSGEIKPRHRDLMETYSCHSRIK